MIQLNSDHFFVRWFYLSEGLKERFHPSLTWGYSSFESTPKQTNLCYMVRSMTLYLPFMFLMQGLMYLLPVLALFVMPWYWYGNLLEVYIPFLQIVAFLAAVGTVVMGVLMFMEKFTTRRRQSSHQAWEDMKNGVVRPPTTWQLFMQYLSTKKQGICPMISIKKDEDK